MFLPLLEVLRCSNNLATERTEAVGIKEAAFTDFTGVSDTFSRPWLRPLVEEDNPCAVDNVGLNTSDVQHLLDLIHPYHIMI